MKNLTKDKLTRKSGFSLLEIVIVIGMISVLLLVLVPNVSAYREKTEDTKIKSEMLNVYLGAETIIESYDTKQELDEYFLLNPQGELVETKEGKRVNDKLTRYTNISDFTNYSFKVALDSNDYPILEYIEYTGPLKSYRFDGDADSFMFKEANLIKESDPIYAWTGEHNVTTNRGAYVYMSAPYYPAMYQIEVRAIDDSIVGAEFGWQWGGSLKGDTVIISKEWQKATAYLETTSSMPIGLRVSGALGKIELRHIKAE